jgi:N-acyl-D-aspartate/D-glutamate deacylase
MDLLIRGGTVIDGTGSAGVRADVAIEGDRICEIGIIDAPADVRVLDAAGCLVCPGFIDIHSHSDFTLLVDPRAISSISQGVTTEVIGNCGHGCAPVRDSELVRSNIYGFEPSYGIQWRSMGEYLDCLEKSRTAVNVASLVPNGNLRLAAAGVVDRPSTLAEIAEEQHLLTESLDAGAIGYSTGLEYGIERGCSESEVQALCQTTKGVGGFYATHTRNLDEQPDDSIGEAIRAARTTGVPLQISHIGVVARLTESSRDAVERALELVDQAVRDGLDVAFDMHTRLFGTTNLSAVLPPWALEGGKLAIEKRLGSTATRSEMRAHPNILAALARGNWDRIVIFDSSANPEISRKSIAQIARERNTDPCDAIYDILLAEIDRLHEVMVIAHVYRAEDIQPAFLHPLCMIGSDATAMAPDGPLAGKSFHGAYSWAAWFWRHFVCDTRLLAPEEAVRRLTSLPARRLGLANRGVLCPGACADVIVFDPVNFAEQATLFAPNQIAQGMRHVVVSGTVSWQGGRATRIHAGKVLRRSRR